MAIKVTTQRKNLNDKMMYEIVTFTRGTVFSSNTTGELSVRDGDRETLAIFAAGNWHSAEVIEK